MQSLSQQQRLLQKLSPQQIQLMKLLQVPTAQLEERIKEEMEENPALELDAEDFEEKPLEEKTQEELGEDFASDTNEDYIGEDDSQDDYSQIDIAEYVKEGDDEDADYNFQADQYGINDEEEKMAFQPKSETSFYEHLMAQVNLLNLDTKHYAIAEFIVGSIDDDGYLRRDIPSIVDDLSFRQSIQATEDEVRDMLLLIQDFEPAGVAASSLQECLLLQLRKKKSNPNVSYGIKILERFFDEFTKKHYDKILKAMNLADEDLKEIIKVIVKLNPKPGAIFTGGAQSETYVVPDFLIHNNNGTLEVTLNQRNAPDLRVSSSFREMLKDYDKGDKKDTKQKEAVLFIKQKIDSAKWFIDAVKQRQQTLMLTMTRIMNLQEDFFLTGDETALKPMILKDVSDRTGMDISTISRVVNSKYVQTEFGTFKLKFFFSESMTTDSGEEVSTREVKTILNDLIQAEDKQSPLSDEKLTELLNTKGYNIARRTVAKYREQLNLSVARLRREL
jgi:RNA polymerase sigma-54 factor